MDYRRQIIASSPHLSHAEGAVASFPDGTDLPLKSLLVDINPVQDLHGQANPYPAGGGKNKLDPSLLKDQAAWNVIELSVKPNTSYIASTNKLRSVGLYTYFNNTGTAGGGSSTEVYNGHPVTVTSTADGKVYFAQRRAESTDSFQNYHFQIEEGSTVTAYAPYENICPISGWDAVGVHNGNTVVTTISLGRTVYGGALNVLTGELVVDRAMVDLGTLTWTYSRVRDFFYVNLTGIKYRADMISSMYKSVGIKTDSQMALEPTGTIGQTLNSTEIKIRNTDYTNAAAFKTAMSGVMLCYELATPLTYHLDPQTVRSLVGHNNIFSDTGNVALEYWAHP